MNDRELLELAAKAAGIDLDDISKRMKDDWADFWNPLTDDGDALRLAVKLGMRLEIDNEWNRTHAQIIPDQPWFTSPHNEDHYAATRLAIVRAAAEIGRAMP